MKAKKIENILIKNGKIYQEDKDFNSAAQDILITNGIITKIEKSVNAPENTYVVDAQHAYIIPGLCDLRCRTGEPGYEHRESLDTVTQSAVFAGFTHLAVLPDSNPIIDSKASVSFLNKQSDDYGISFSAIGAASKHLEGEELTEMYDMFLSGVRLFSNANKGFRDAQAIKRALLYSKTFGGLITNHAMDVSLSQGGQVNESEATIHSGLKTANKLAEYTQVQKEIAIAEYCNAPLHFSLISCAESVEAIQQAQKKGLKITCDVSLNHLIFTDQDTLTYNSNFKLEPPLRENEDRVALIKGVNTGVITAIVSDHTPYNSEEKDVEFDFAAIGSTALQTFTAAYNTHLKEDIDWQTFIRCAAHNPRKYMHKGLSSISVGSTADLFIFDPTKEWVLNANTNRSKSKNSTFWDKKLTGMTLATVYKNHLHQPID